jgi:PAS domain S-box-containing protein
MAGAWLLFFVVFPLKSTGFTGPRWPGISWLAYLASGFIWLVFLIWAVLPTGSWAEIAFCGLVAFYLIVYPWLVHYASFPFRTSLHARITLVLGIAVAFPLISTVAWISYREGLNTRDRALAHLQRESYNLAAGVSYFVDLHRSGVLSLAQTPGMLAQDPEVLTRVIQSFQTAYPDTRSFTIYDANNIALARGTGAQVFPASTDPLLDRTRQILKPVGGLYVSPLLPQRLLGFGVPILDDHGVLQRVVTCYFGIDQIASAVDIQQDGDSTSVMLLDENGSVIIKPEPDVNQVFQGISGGALMDSLLSSDQPTGGMDIDLPSGETLAGYAGVPGLGWYVVSAESSSIADAGLYASRSMAFCLLLACLSVAVIAGWWIGGRLTQPLETLSRAAGALAEGNSGVPLPSSSITEIEMLSKAFGSMRASLDAHTRERIAAENELRRAKADLEVRVDERTQELRTELEERTRIEQTLSETRNRFHLVIDHSPVMVFTTDADLRYTWVYHPWPGFTSEGLLHRRDDEVLPAGSAADLMALKRTVLASGHGSRGEVRVHTEAGIVIIDVAIEPMFDVNGQVIGLSGAAMDVTEQKRLEDEMRRSVEQIEVQRRLIEQRESERVQIARDLHDGPLQDLISLNFLVSSGIPLAQDASLQTTMSAASQSIKDLIDSLRAFAGELRPPALAKFGLAKAIASYAETFEQKHADLKVDLDVEDDAQAIPEPQRLVLFRIFQEGMNNIYRHSRAGRVTVRLQLAARRVILEIEDNGVGFNAPDDWVELARQGHLGLVGMRERAEAAGGNLVFRSAPGEGTWIHVQLPVEYGEKPTANKLVIS